MGSNREESNIAIARLEKLSFLMGNILMVAIIISPTVAYWINYIKVYFMACVLEIRKMLMFR